MLTRFAGAVRWLPRPPPSPISSFRYFCTGTSPLYASKKKRGSAKKAKRGKTAENSVSASPTANVALAAKQDVIKNTKAMSPSVQTKAKPAAAPPSPSTPPSAQPRPTFTSNQALSSSSSPAAPATTTAEVTNRPRRTYAHANSVANPDAEVQRLKRELIQTRLQLAKTGNSNSSHASFYEGILARLSETDKAAQHSAASLRYTGMALRCAHDNLEVELRRLMMIGLTPAEVDAAALEAGARQYIRQNIGFHADHVASVPSAITDVVRASQKVQPTKKT